MNKRLLRLCLSQFNIERTAQMNSFLAQGKNPTLATADSMFRPIGINGGMLLIKPEDLFGTHLEAPEHEAYSVVAHDRDLLQKVSVIRSFVTSSMSDEAMLSKLCFDVALEFLSAAKDEAFTFIHLYLLSLGLMEGKVYSSGTLKTLMERTRYMAGAMRVIPFTPSVSD